MSNGARHKISKLISRDGPRCHYCFRFLYRSKGTCDHVVPKSMGGLNSLENYVLACQPCNELRGTDLDWCDCSFCGPLIAEFKASPGYAERIFLGIMQYNRSIIRYRQRHWKVYIHKSVHSFNTWEDAMHFALTYGKEPNHGLRKVDRRHE